MTRIFLPRQADGGAGYLDASCRCGDRHLSGQYFAPEAKGHSVPEVMDAIYYREGVIRPAALPSFGQIAPKM
jgi:hypothetical protein